VQDVETFLAVSKLAEAIGTIAVLLIAVWAFAKGHIVPGYIYQRDQEELAELRAAVRDLCEAVASLERAVERWERLLGGSYSVMEE
jgi:hypothetical protein